MQGKWIMFIVGNVGRHYWPPIHQPTLNWYVSRELFNTWPYINWHSIVTSAEYQSTLGQYMADILTDSQLSVRLQNSRFWTFSEGTILACEAREYGHVRRENDCPLFTQQIRSEQGSCNVTEVTEIAWQLHPHLPAVISHRRLSAQKRLDKSSGGRLVANCVQSLPEKVKPCSGPLVKIIILLSVCTASSLNTLALNIPWNL